MELMAEEYEKLKSSYSEMESQREADHEEMDRKLERSVAFCCRFFSLCSSPMLKPLTGGGKKTSRSCFFEHGSHLSRKAGRPGQEEHYPEGSAGAELLRGAQGGGASGQRDAQGGSQGAGGGEGRGQAAGGPEDDRFVCFTSSSSPSSYRCRVCPARRDHHS